MKFNYYPETDSLYIDLSERESVDSREVAPGIIADLDAEGRLVGIDIDRASQTVNLSRIEANPLILALSSLLARDSVVSSICVRCADNIFVQ